MTSKLLNIVLITADSLRADYCGFINSKRRSLTPFLNKLAKNSLTFKNAYANAPYTAMSIPAIMTGKFPIFNSSPAIGARITIAEYLKKLGYLTIGIISSNPYAKFFSGNGRGFILFKEVGSWNHTSESKLLPSILRDLFQLRRHDVNKREEFVLKVSRLLSTVLLSKKPYPQAIINYALAKLLLSSPPGPVFYPANDEDALKVAKNIILGLKKEKISRPVFMWIHLMSSHMPYSFPYENVWNAFFEHLMRKAFIRVLINRQNVTKKDVMQIRKYYSDGVRRLDSLIRELFEVLEEGNFQENTVYIITADHGEELFDRGDFGHSGKMIDELLRVPLIIYGTEENLRIETPVSSVDIFPTIIDLTHKKLPKFSKSLIKLLDGNSLFDMLVSSRGDRLVLSEGIYSANEELFLGIISNKIKKIDWSKHLLKIRISIKDNNYVTILFDKGGIKQVEDKTDRENKNLIKIAERRYKRITNYETHDKAQEIIYKTLKRVYSI